MRRLRNLVDWFGRSAQRRLAEQDQRLLQIEAALEKAALETRLLRAVQTAGKGLKEERFSIENRQQTLDKSYVRVMSYMMVAQENVRHALGRENFYNIQAVYPPVTSDDSTMQDFFPSVRRHFFG
jgi:hypothetical protein